MFVYNIATTDIKVESLFIEKLQEKYQLNKRDIQRAFKTFDTDGSGTLDINEMTKVIGLYLNGVDPNLIKELVMRYDVDGDGVISLAEFQQLLLSRSSPDPNQWITVEHLTSSAQKVSLAATDDDATQSSRGQNSGPESPKRNEYNAKILLQNIRGCLVGKSREQISEGKIAKSERLKMKNSELIESIALDIFMKEFLPYMRNSKIGQGTNSKVSFANFARVLSKFSSPGSPPPHRATLHYLFETCCDPGTYDDVDAVADPAIIAGMVFDKGGEAINRFGFMQQIPAKSSTSRPEVGPGASSRLLLLIQSSC